MKRVKSGGRTLLWSVIMSAPGPLVIGLGMLAGTSATQIADLVRRSAELLAILVSYITYLITAGLQAAEAVKKQHIQRRANLFTGAMMCLGGCAMLLLAVFSGNLHSGKVISGLIIAVLGVVANTVFWRKYTRLAAEEQDPILLVQARLYGAKSLVDGCVTLALLAVMVLPATQIAYYIDKVGSCIVAVYLLLCGLRTIRERVKGMESP